VAQLAGFRFLDTGAMYRAVTFAALERCTPLTDEDGLAALAETVTIGLTAEGVSLDARDVTGRLRDPAVDRAVSAVSRVSGVRTALVRQQRAIAADGSIVVVGRDIGTVVLPDAALKVYLTAAVEVRARRRHLEMEARAEADDFSQVADDLARRDRMDTERSDSPLRPAADAVIIDTDELGVEEVAREVMRLARL
jgi:cytidylate kinase